MRHLTSASVLLLAIVCETRADVSKDNSDLERTITLMSKIGSSYGASFSPDGKRIAFISDVTGSPQAWTVPTTGGWPELVTALRATPRRSGEQMKTIGLLGGMSWRSTSPLGCSTFRPRP